MNNFRINKITNYKGNFEEKVEEIYQLTKFLRTQYPDYENWFYNKAIKRIKEQKGEIFFVEKSGEIIGLTILKNTEEEKKICTIFVKEKFRNLGIGSILISESINYLGTKKPIITIPEKNILYFSGIIKKYGWEISEKINKYNTPEIVLNKK